MYSSEIQKFRANLVQLCSNKGIEYEFTGSNEGGRQEEGQRLATGLNQGMLLIKMDLVIEDTRFELDLRETKNEFDLKEDAVSRDFTVNSTFLSISQSQPVFFFTATVINLSEFFYLLNFKGEADTKNRIIKCHNPLDFTFEDASRFLRLVRFKVDKDLTIDTELDFYVKQNGSQKVMSGHYFHREFDKAFQKKKTFPQYCQELVNYKLLPSGLRNPEMLTGTVILEGMMNFRDNVEAEAMIQANFLDVKELRIIIFISMILKNQTYGSSEIISRFARFGKKVLKRGTFRKIFSSKGDRFHEILNWGSFAYAYNLLFNNTFRQDFSHSGDKEYLIQNNAISPNFGILNFDNFDDIKPIVHQTPRAEPRVEYQSIFQDEVQEEEEMVKNLPTDIDFQQARHFLSDDDVSFPEDHIQIEKHGQGLLADNQESEDESEEDDLDSNDSDFDIENIKKYYPNQPKAQQTPQNISNPATDNSNFLVSFQEKNPKSFKILP